MGGCCKNAEFRVLRGVVGLAHWVGLVFQASSHHNMTDFLCHNPCFQLSQFMMLLLQSIIFRPDRLSGMSCWACDVAGKHSMDTCKFDAALFDKCYHSIFVYRNSAFAKKKNMFPAEQHKTSPLHPLVPSSTFTMASSSGSNFNTPTPSCYSGPFRSPGPGSSQFALQQFPPGQFTRPAINLQLDITPSRQSLSECDIFSPL